MCFVVKTTLYIIEKGEPMLEDDVRKLVDGVCRVNLIDSEYDNFCPFCFRETEKSCSMEDIEHTTNCLYKLAKKIKAEMEKEQ